MLCYVKFNGIISLTKTQMEIHMNLLQFDRFDMLKAYKTASFFKTNHMVNKLPCCLGSSQQNNENRNAGIKAPIFVIV